MREVVEPLEDHADLGTPPGDLALVQLVEAIAALLVADEHPVDVEAPGVDLLEMVDAPQEGRLAGPGWSEEALGRCRRERRPPPQLR